MIESLTDITVSTLYFEHIFDGRSRQQGVCSIPLNKTYATYQQPKISEFLSTEVIFHNFYRRDER